MYCGNAYTSKVLTGIDCVIVICSYDSCFIKLGQSANINRSLKTHIIYVEVNKMYLVNVYHNEMELGLDCVIKTCGIKTCFIFG